ncbi:deoxyguanosinetriphosphate triphosphohydrolase [Fodinicola acaciae]|uniref:deoxyguanosinetriphosphate triphosphohydrolase n=1 Tax=Fodinicola acaciae TaxID=2681555 RepID=UPI0013D89A6F|nr:deoxyguanosinetriphosphate triphosphohydrolase [Fodinicola acaciae]
MDAHDEQRWVAEPAKPTGADRTPYQRDRARVLHSAGFRRLAAKTQVVTAGVDDFPRTRLTHSLEVAQIARELGAALGCDPDIVDTAGLAHDLGHPPFGHNGEDALDAVSGACGGFEGNAQTLRVLTRLEAKVEGAGLNLTRASLDATCKYPWPRGESRKFGVYADDLPVFEWLRAGAEGRRRCLEAQVMDWADDVAYSVHDVEDGVHAGFIKVSTLDDPDERLELAGLAARMYSDETASELAAVLEEFRTHPALLAVSDYDGGHRAQAALKALTSTLTGRFSAAAVEATRAAYGPGPLSRYAADLVVPRQTRAECALLKAIAWRWVMQRRDAQWAYARQRELVTGVVTALTVRAPDALDPVFRPLWTAAPNDAARLRVIVDQVACLTDASIERWANRLGAR